MSDLHIEPITLKAANSQPSGISFQFVVYKMGLFAELQYAADQYHDI